VTGSTTADQHGTDAPPRLGAPTKLVALPATPRAAGAGVATA
jgi:hypothetical protein